MFIFRKLRRRDEKELRLLFKKRLTGREPGWNIGSFIWDRNCCGIVIEDSATGRIAGFGALALYQAPVEGKAATIQDMVVAEEFSGQGLGKKLVEKLIAVARRRHARSIWLTSRNERATALRLYLSEGFVKKETNFLVKKLS
jgi:GNAT superfamily N-acetyltransferase